MNQCTSKFQKTFIVLCEIDIYISDSICKVGFHRHRVFVSDSCWSNKTWSVAGTRSIWICFQSNHQAPGSKHIFWNVFFWCPIPKSFTVPSRNMPWTFTKYLIKISEWWALRGCSKDVRTSGTRTRCKSFCSCCVQGGRSCFSAVAIYSLSFLKTLERKISGCCW